MFQDDLLLRSPQGFELTLRGRKILQELEDCCRGWKVSLRRTCSIQSGRRATSAFQALTTSARLWSPRLCRQYANGRYQVQFEFLPWQSGIAEPSGARTGRSGLHIDDGLLPSHFHSERLYREDWICAIARGRPLGDRLSLRQYLAQAIHRCIYVCRCADDPGQAVGGCRRQTHFVIRVPYFGVALQCLPGTDLVLTVTSGMSSVVTGNRALRIVKAPHELHPFHFLMAWHPRLNSDPRHVWLREAMRSTTAASQ